MKLTKKIQVAWLDARIASSGFTFLRAMNIIALKVSFYIGNILKSGQIWGHPYAVSIEPLNVCNLQCPECPTGLRTLTRTKGTMSIDSFKLTLKNLNNRTWYLNLYFQGEPFMHPNIFDMIRIAKENNLVIGTSSNGHYFSEGNAIKTVQSGLDRLIISLDGTSQDSYEKYRIGGNYNEVMDGIGRIVRAKKQLNSRLPLVIIQFLVFKHNQHEIVDLKKNWTKLGVDKLEIKTAQIYDAQHKAHLIPTINKYSRYQTTNNNTALKGRYKNNCWRHWSSAVITWNGDVVPCCFDKDAQHIMGNVTKQGMKYIWKTKGYSNFRTLIRTQQSKISICQNCPISRK